MTQRMTDERRACPRVAAALNVRLGRKVGNHVIARTRDLSVAGARVVSGRPLRIDEELQFDLELPAAASISAGPPEYCASTATTCTRCASRTSPQPSLASSAHSSTPAPAEPFVRHRSTPLGLAPCRTKPAGPPAAGG